MGGSKDEACVRTDRIDNPERMVGDRRREGFYEKQRGTAMGSGRSLFYGIIDGVGQRCYRRLDRWRPE